MGQLEASSIRHFAMAEGRGLINKARVIGHEVDKVANGRQAVLTTLEAVVGTLLDPLEQYWHFPPQGDFYIDRG